MKYIHLLLFPLGFFIYSFVMDKSAENFYDLVAIIWGTIGVVGSILSIVIYNLTRKYNKEDKWYINVLIGLGGCILAFLLLMVYSRING